MLAETHWTTPWHNTIAISRLKYALQKNDLKPSLKFSVNPANAIEPTYLKYFFDRARPTDTVNLFALVSSLDTTCCYSSTSLFQSPITFDSKIG